MAVRIWSSGVSNAGYAANCRRVFQMGKRLHGTKFRFESAPAPRPLFTTTRRLILVDTLALVRKLEANGLATKQAEAITEAFKEVQNDNYLNVSHNFVSKADMEKVSQHPFWLYKKSISFPE